jgi:hypothetical protein
MSFIPDIEAFGFEFWILFRIGPKRTLCPTFGFRIFAVLRNLGERFARIHFCNCRGNSWDALPRKRRSIVLRPPKSLNLRLKPLNCFLMLADISSELNPTEKVGDCPDQDAHEDGEEDCQKKRDTGKNPFLIHGRR